ncbi:MAG: ATP-binding protein [Kiritimatiellae bacterium]|nr:ATP-binding protein [Kiritimatiellia bacterium]
MKFVGRKSEIEALKQWQNRPAASQLSAVYGRRRIGKTRLVEEAARGCRFLKFEGLEGEDEKAQQRHFIHTLYTFSGKREHQLFRSDNWIDLFILLSDYLGDEPAIVLFDELQWMAAEKTGLVSRLKYAWDNYFRPNNRVHLILCGSVSSFLVKKVVNSKALYGRIDLVLHLRAMALSELGPAFMKGRSIYEQLEYYLAVGGIPKYFELFNTSQSARLNLHRLSFSRDAFLFNEVNRLFVSHFGKSPHYANVVRELAARGFLDRSSVIDRTSLAHGGGATRVLEELELAEFVESYGPIGNPEARMLKRYRVADPFLRFYYTFIFPVRTRVGPRALPIHQCFPDVGYAVWRGLSFEHYCRQHTEALAALLGFSAVRYDVGPWFRRDDMKSGAQIDLLFKRADNVLTLCEVKHRRTVSADVITQVENKVEVLLNSPLNRGRDFTIEKVLISVHPPVPSVYEAGYFSKIVDLRELLAFA